MMRDQALRVANARRALLALTVFALSYVGTFALNSHFGGYWAKPERDGHDRWSIGMLMHTAALWQPRFGYWAPYRSDWLGSFYSPLIRLDRKFIHPTHYLSDPAFGAWADATAISDWHPAFRADLLTARAKHQ